MSPVFGEHSQAFITRRPLQGLLLHFLCWNYSLLLYTFRPCLALQKSLGPIIPTPRRSPTRCTFLRRRTSPEFSLAEYSMVCLPAPPSILVHHACFIYHIGVVVVLFFQCMGILLSSAYRARKGVRWGLVIYTVVSFLFVTMFTTLNLDIQSISYINNREFPGNDELPLGPLGYQYLIYSKAITIVTNLMFLLNNWLADGLLVIFGPNSVIQVSHISYSRSSIAVTSFM